MNGYLFLYLEYIPESYLHVINAYGTRIYVTHACVHMGVLNGVVTGFKVYSLVTGFKTIEFRV